MERSIRFSLLLLCIAAAAYPQGPPSSQTLIPVSVAPSGNCGGNTARLVAPSGDIYTCVNGTWTKNGGGGGVTSGTLTVGFVSATTLAIGPLCPSSACLYRVASTTYTLSSSPVVTLISGTGTVYFYINNTGGIIVGVSAGTTPSVTCGSGCTVLTGISAFPQDTIPLWTWNASAGVWAGSGIPQNATLSIGQTLVAGTNIVLTETGNTIRVDSAGPSGSIPLTQLATQAADTVVLNSTGGAASPTAVAMPATGTNGCAGAANALTYNTSTHALGCNSITTGAGSFNPGDPTQFYRDHFPAVTGFNNPLDGWGNAGTGCATAGGSGANGFTIQTYTSAAFWASAAGTGLICEFVFPAQGGAGTYGSGTYDAWSGATPSHLLLWSTYQTLDTNGTHYVGLNPSGSNFTNFIGCRQVGAGNWFAVIINAGTVTAVDTGATHDTSPHRVQVDNGATTATVNTIRCVIDGTHVGTATGGQVIPPQSGGWNFMYGATAAGATAAVFADYEYMIYLTGLPRL